MKKVARPLTASKSGGFSTLEALVALLLVALVGLIVVQAIAGGMRASSAGGARAAQAVRLLQLDAALRRAVGAVDVPYWVGRVEPLESAEGLTLPYSGGEEARSLRIRAADGYVTLDTVDAEAGAEPLPPSPPVRFGPFEQASAAPLFDGERLWGVLVTVRTHAGTEAVELRARIASRPLLAEAAQ